VAEHPVERETDLADLGPGIGVRDPLGQRDLAAGQGQLGDPGRGRRDPPQRPQRQPHKPHTEQAGQDQRPAEHDGLGEFHVLQDVLRRPQRHAGDHRGPVVTRRGQQLVGTESGEGNALWLPGPFEGLEGGQVGVGQAAVPVGHGGIDHLASVDPGAEGLAALLLPAVLGTAGHVVDVVIVVPGRVLGLAVPAPVPAVIVLRLALLEAGAVTGAGRAELLVDLAHQALAQPDVGDQPDGRAGHGEQGEQPGDQPAAQGPPAQPASEHGRPPAGSLAGLAHW
jgi:hypothetical protein